MPNHQEQKDDREQLLDKLNRRYSNAQIFVKKTVYWRKKLAWGFIIGGAKLIKRLVDIIASTLLLILLSPLFLLIAAAIKLWDGGPIFYSSVRVGLWGKEFSFPKFRTMVVGADAQLKELKEQADFPGSIRFKMKADPRVTPVGKILRRFSLDELPQLWCVLKGEMSLVGPRPPLPTEVALYTLEQRGRLDAKPGLTCIWQVKGRSTIPFDRQVKMDREYIESQSFWLDIKLLLKTIPAILFGPGAY